MRLKLFHLENFKEVRGLRKSRARGGGGPPAGVMHCEMPTGGASEREAAHRQAILIYRVKTLRMAEGFEQIRFAGKSAPVAVASVKMKNKGVGRNKFAGA